MTRTLGDLDALADLGAVLYATGDEDPLVVGAAGDIDGDGTDDFIIGAPLADGTAGTDAGKAYVIPGSPAPGGDERSLAEVGQSAVGFVVEGTEAGDNLGASVGGGFDVNADGVDDGLVGAPFADSAPAAAGNGGETYVISPIRPDEVSPLLLGRIGSLTRLEWSVPDLALSYNVYRGSLDTLRAVGFVRTSDMAKLACGITSDIDADGLPDTEDGAQPSVDQPFFYLVTSINFLGEGPLGPPGTVPPRIHDDQCPVATGGGGTGGSGNGSGVKQTVYAVQQKPPP
jgi:hypothetical protein